MITKQRNIIMEAQVRELQEEVRLLKEVVKELSRQSELMKRAFLPDGGPPNGG
jgi:hypothetical protein